MIEIVVFMNPIPHPNLTHTHRNHGGCRGMGLVNHFFSQTYLSMLPNVVLRKRAARKMESTDGPVPFFEKKGTLEFFL